MYYLFSLISGILISLMLVANGVLSEQYGVNSSTVIIHIVGLILILLITLIKQKLKLKKLPFYFFLGGIIGVVPTAFCSIAFSRISVSAIVALELLGQSTAGIIFDSFGFLGIEKRQFKKRNIIGIAVIILGIVSMMDKYDPVAISVAFTSGALLVVSQILNAKLSDNTNLYTSTLINYVTGLITAILVLILFRKNEPSLTSFVVSPKLYMYIGGILGVCIVSICNITILKIPVFYMTLFTFIGQVFSGIAIDSILTNSFPIQNIVGGIFTSAGLALNLIMDSKYEKKQSRS